MLASLRDQIRAVEHHAGRPHTDPEARRMKLGDGGFTSNQDLESVGQRVATVFAPVKAAEKEKQNGQDPYAPKRSDTPQVAGWRQRMGTAEAQIVCRWGEIAVG